MKKLNWKFILPPPVLAALLFASCNLIQEMPQDFVETYGNIAYVERVEYTGLVENDGTPKVTETQNFKITYHIKNDGNFDLSPEFTFEGCEIKNPHVVTEKKRVYLTIAGENLKTLKDGAEFKVSLTLYKTSQKVLQSSYEIGMRYVYTGGPEIPKGTVRIEIPGLDLPPRYTLSVEDSTKFKTEYDEEKGSWFVTTIAEGGVAEGEYTLELEVKDKDGNVLKDENGKDITITIEVEVSAEKPATSFTEKEGEKSLDEFIEEVKKNLPEESKNPPTEPENPPKTGKVEIEVKVPDGYTLEIEGENKDKFEVKKGEDGSCKIVVKDEGELPEGEYDIKLVVKDEEENEVKEFDKKIEVSAGEEPTGGFADEPDDEPFKITEEMIERTTVYVRGSDAPWYDAKHPDDAQASDTNSGARLHPFETIQRAIKEVIDRNDGEEYTIYIDGTLTQTEAPSDGKKGMADFSDLNENLILTIKSRSETTKATLDANALSRVINAAPASGALKLTIKNLVMMKGQKSDYHGGGILFDSSNSTLNMEGCTLTNNTAGLYGGGIYFKNVGESSLTIKNCTVNGNNAQNGGGVYVDGGTLEITGGEISNNTANSTGGGIHVENSTLTTKTCIFSKNSANSSYGGALYNINAIVTMTDDKISENQAAICGGVYVDGGTLTMKNCKVESNIATAYKAGGIMVTNSGKLTIEDNTIISRNEVKNSDSNPDVQGGGVYINDSTFEMNGGAISGNEVKNSDSKLNAQGGGVYVNDGSFTMKGGSISGNTASQDGGGVYVAAGTFNMHDGTIGGENEDTANTAQNGGGVYVANNSTFTMSGGEISSNKAIVGNLPYNGQGGGVYVNSATFEISGTAKITGNNAAKSGGGIYVYKDNENTTHTMTGGEISGNEAGNNGAGVYINGGTFTITNGEISGNTATNSGGGVYNKDGKIMMSGGTVGGEKNKAKNGGGVYIESGIFEMSDTATISGNSATENGGGVYVAGGSFTMEGGTATMSGGTISGNSAAKGKGAYINSTFNMSNDAKFAKSDDIYLDNAKTIHIAGDLTASTPVATITLPDSSYPADNIIKQVLSAGTGVTITQGICDKFAVTPQTNGTRWKVALSGNTGVLKKDNVQVGEGGISVELPDLGKDYTFVLKSNGAPVVDKLKSGSDLILEEVTDSNNVKKFTIEIQDASGNQICSNGGSALPITLHVPLYPFEVEAQIYIKAELNDGNVIDPTISVIIMPQS